MNQQSGMTMIEALVVAFVVAVVASATGFYGLNWIRAERQRGAVYGLYVQMNQARAEAVHRNRASRLLIDTASRTISVVDLNDPSIGSDDEVISAITMEPGVDFGRPDVGAAITLDALPGSRFEAVFAQDGTLSSGVGSVGLQVGDRFRRISVYAGGGIVIERWNGSAWVDGA